MLTTYANILVVKIIFPLFLTSSPITSRDKISSLNYSSEQVHFNLENSDILHFDANTIYFYNIMMMLTSLGSYELSKKTRFCS